MELHELMVGCRRITFKEISLESFVLSRGVSFHNTINQTFRLLFDSIHETVANKQISNNSSKYNIHDCEEM